MNNTATSAQRLWDETTTLVKHRVFSSRLWMAMETATPIAFEESVLAIGFPEQAPIGTLEYISSLQTPEHIEVIRRALSDTVGCPARFELIEGTRLADWKEWKRRRSLLTALRESVEETQGEQVQAGGEWFDLTQCLYQRFMAYPHHRLPQNQARFLLEILPDLADAEDRIAAGGEGAELAQRQGEARLLRQLSNWLEIPMTILALEIERHRGRVSVSPNGNPAKSR